MHISPKVKQVTHDEHDFYRVDSYQDE